MNEHLLSIFESIKRDRPQSKNDRVLIIDSLNTFIRIFTTVPTLSDNGVPVGGIIGFLRSVGSNIREFNATRCILVFDGKGGSQRRKKIYPEYKSGRTNKCKPKRIEGLELTVDEEDQSRIFQMRRLMDYLDCLPLQIICIDQVEADDVIAHCCTCFDDKTKIRIVSTDRDFLQLVSNNIEVYSPIKKKLYTPETLQEEFSFHPDNYLAYRVFTGDTSDNIPGIDGLGLKTFMKIFKPLLDNHVSEFQEYIDFCKHTPKPNKKKIHESVISNAEIIERNYKLMQLSDVDISSNTKITINNKIHSNIPYINKLKFKHLVVEDYLESAFKNFDRWLYSTFNGLTVWATP